ncbi:MAG: hypothetical protein IKQ27_13170 [Lachnospiraceae bacterium]|nr:hypothetical protein [Lachnospiraceae bacterium]
MPGMGNSQAVRDRCTASDGSVSHQRCKRMAIEQDKTNHLEEMEEARNRML